MQVADLTESVERVASENEKVSAKNVQLQADLEQLQSAALASPMISHHSCACAAEQLALEFQGRGETGQAAFDAASPIFGGTGYSLNVRELQDLLQGPRRQPKRWESFVEYAPPQKSSPRSLPSGDRS